MIKTVKASEIRVGDVMRGIGHVTGVTKTESFVRVSGRGGAVTRMNPETKVMVRVK